MITNTDLDVARKMGECTRATTGGSSGYSDKIRRAYNYWAGQPTFTDADRARLSAVYAGSPDPGEKPTPPPAVLLSVRWVNPGDVLRYLGRDRKVDRIEHTFIRTSQARKSYDIYKIYWSDGGWIELGSSETVYRVAAAATDQFPEE